MTRTCDQCGKHLVTHRKGARFCDEDCKNTWHNEQRRKDDAPSKRLTGVNGSEGSHGGNVRSVQEARELQEQQKDKARWTLIVREHIGRTLVETGYFHADDLAALGVPPEHDAIKGSQIAAYACRKWMKAVGERKCQHKAANSRKAKIYRVTDLGREKLVGVSTGVRPPQGAEGSCSPSPLCASADSGEKPAGSENPEGNAGCVSSALDRPRGSQPSISGAGSSLAVHSGDGSPGANTGVAGEPAQLFSLDEAREGPRSAITDPRAA